MGSAIAFLVGRTIFGQKITEPIARIILTAGLFLAALGTIATLVTLYNHHVINRYQQKQTAAAQPATDQAAKERAQDVTNIETHEQEMHNAVAAQPDQPIAPTSRVRACDQLRRAGRNPPACR